MNAALVVIVVVIVCCAYAAGMEHARDLAARDRRRSVDQHIVDHERRAAALDQARRGHR